MNTLHHSDITTTNLLLAQSCVALGKTSEVFEECPPHSWHVFGVEEWEGRRGAGGEHPPQILGLQAPVIECACVCGV